MQKYAMPINTPVLLLFIFLLLHNCQVISPLHALNSKRCYSHMYLTQQWIPNQLGCYQPLGFPCSTLSVAY